MAAEAARLGQLDRRRAAALQAAVAGAAASDKRGLAAAEVAISAALVDYAASRRQVVAAANLHFIDPALAARGALTEGVLSATADPQALEARMAQLEAVNPVHQALYAGLQRYRWQWARLPHTPIASGPELGVGDRSSRVQALKLRLGAPDGGSSLLFDAPLQAAVESFQRAHGLAPTGRADTATVAALNLGPEPFERRIEANLERARALPPPLHRDRYVWVNVPSQTLRLVEGRRPPAEMKVVVGAPDAQTPPMAGLLRYAVINPYWNVPVDLVSQSLAPDVRRFGPAWLEKRGMEVLSDWGDHPVVLDPTKVDWRAAQEGRTELRVRQRPGGDNMMGRVKFMLPNELGIYLHDTPDRGAFTAERRSLSAGCVRLEHAAVLLARYFGPKAWNRLQGAAAGRLDLQEPVTVYITYLTAAPDGRGGVAFHPDLYGQDGALQAALR